MEWSYTQAQCSWRFYPLYGGKLQNSLPLQCPAGTTNPGATWKPDIPLKGIQNPVPQKLDNPIERIRNLVKNRTRNQWPRGLPVQI